MFGAFDTETECISDTNPNPRVVCLTWYWPGLASVSKLPEHGLVAAADGADALEHVFFELCVAALATRTILVAHNAAFDIGVLLRRCPALTPLVYTLLAEGLLQCTLLRETLWSIARGEYVSENGQRGRYFRGKFFGMGLADSCALRMGVEVAKGEDTWRTRYVELLDVPSAQWPAAARDYALLDAKLHHELAVKQEMDERAAPIRPGAYVYADAGRKTWTSWSLATCRIRGIWTDPRVADEVAADIEKRLAAELDELVAAGLVRPAKWRAIKKEWARPTVDTKAVHARVIAAFNALGREVPTKQDTGNVDAGKLSLEIAGTVDPLLLKFRRYKAADKIRGFGKAVRGGVHHPLHSSPQTLVDTGRTAWKAPNLQQLPKEEGSRECFLPNPGFLLASIDYNQLELCALAQVCLWMFGESRMAELINAGMDLHCDLGANFLSIDYATFKARLDAKDKEIKTIRQFAKEGSFGFPGGMGISRFIDSVVAKDHLRHLRPLFTEATVKALRDAWFASYPEMRQYFDWASRIDKRERQIVQFASGRIRGNVGFCDGANGNFQGLAADGATDAMNHLVRAMWAEPESPLFGSRLLVFVHDEFVFEVPEDRAHEAVTAAYDLVMRRMGLWLPNINVRGSIALMRRWRKDADEYRDSSGRLRPWEDSPKFEGRWGKA